MRGRSVRVFSLLAALLVANCLYADDLPSVEQRLDNIEQQLSIQSQCQSRPASCYFADVDLIPAQLRILNGNIGEANGFAGRLKLGYEGENGFGIRALWWGYDGNSERNIITETSNEVDLDVFQSFDLAATRLTVGAGIRYATFEMSAWYGDGRFTGEGASVFAEMNHPTPIGSYGELALTGRTRMSLLAGDWDSVNNSFVVGANDDTIAILEASLGVEFRRRICSDACWYVGVAPEIQRWDGGTFDRIGTLGFLGVGMETGVTW
jgi:hypothetical protein